MRTPRIVRVLAPNPDVFTLEGTNTWVVGDDPAIVIDPGPDDAGHLGEVAREADRVAAILLTHHHPDHAPGASPLSASARAPVLAHHPEAGEWPLRDGQELTFGALTITVVHTPGHTPDHTVFLLGETGALFTGDSVLGRGTSVIDPPEGDLALYIRSLERMRDLRPRTIYPGHGPVVFDADAKLAEYLEHRAEREAQVMTALGQDKRTPEELVADIYTEYPMEVRPLAARSVLAHLLKLEKEGRVARTGSKDATRFFVAQSHACERCGRPARGGSRLCPSCSVELLQERPAP